MKKRFKIAKKLSDDLFKFDENSKGKFMCPVCMDVYDANDKNNITDAHIIPSAARGKDLTLLCKSCNSIFGSNQDKWFGECLNILLDEKKTILAAKTKSKYIEVNGVQVCGDLKESKDGGLDLFLHKDRNPPGKLDSILHPKSLEISIEIPLVKRQKQVEVGYLTAAYLMWFKQLGYSWIFQGHLNDVRNQIQNPEKDIIQGSFLIDIPTERIIEPWIGVLDLGERAYPCAAIYDRLVIFPTVSDNNIFTSIHKKIHNSDTADFQSLNITNAHNHSGPMGLIYKTSNLVFPDHFVAGKIEKSKVLFFPNSIDPPQWLHSMKKEEHENIKNNGDYDLTTIKVR